ncbi:MAG: hypothetical protein IJW06_06300 [Clostridia bacterium]|nr:hypothetical protein [Clostridia bacterium]
MKYTKYALLRRAYTLLENSTPLKYDCGKLCEGACCRADTIRAESDAGMMLLPYEDVLIGGCEEFEIKDTSDGKILTCSGTCERIFRPFMCRIFPYYARIDEETGRISLRVDPRAANICPIATKKKRTRHSVYFHRNALRAVRILMHDEDFKKELIKTSNFCDGLYEMYRTLI